jgi:hypothetical protein
VGLDEIADELYGLPPEDFIGARDDRAATAKAAGDTGLAKQIAALRRPTKAAWVANQLARQRPAELDGLLNLSNALGDAQRTLDGDQLRSLSTQRHQLVAAMSRAARGLAQQAGQPVSDSVEREVQDILEASLADPEAADELRRGRLTKSVSYAGFGPAAPADAKPQPRQPSAPGEDPRVRQAEQAVAEAEADAEQTLAKQRAADDDVEAAEQSHRAVRARVDELAEALETARREETTAAKAIRDARNDQRAAARVAQGSATRAEQARARLAKLRASD